MNTSVWPIFAQKLQCFMRENSLVSAQCVVLLPYVQLIAKARASWYTLPAQDFCPRFETTHTWTRSLPSPVVGTHDLRGIAAFDLPNTQFWLQQAALPWQGQSAQETLAAMANTLALLAQAQVPAQRMSWYDRTQAALATLSGNNAWLEQEAAFTQLALLWAAQSTYPSDVLYAQKPSALVVLQGLQADPLATQLLAHCTSPHLLLCWEDLLQEAAEANKANTLLQKQVNVYHAQDIQQEALAACAALLRALEQDVTPVALVAQDRLLTRRISALLLAQGVAVQDQTGWPLSTTHAAATLLAPLQAALPQAGWAEILAWLHQSPAFATLNFAALEQRLSREPNAVQPIPELPDAVGHLRTNLSAVRSLPAWIDTLRQALEAGGQWQYLQTDAAGLACIQATYLNTPASLNPFTNEVWSLNTFIQWLRQVLEAGRFRPEGDGRTKPQVCILPLEQLLGRDFQHVVFPGCDNKHFPRIAKLQTWWGPKQRALLGFADSQTLLQARTTAWGQALRAAHVDLLHRHADADEPLAPSPYLESWLLKNPAFTQQHAASLLATQSVVANPLLAPAPTAKGVAIKHLSASAYQWLRDCPYRFFAQRILKLEDAFDPDATLDARAHGTWLHTVLHRFHADKSDQSAAPAWTDDLRTPAGLEQAAQVLDAIARDEWRRQGLETAAFLPWRTVWPRLRTGYLSWLLEHQQAGWRFAAGELPLERALHTGTQTIALKGTLDRVDRLGQALAVMDYKSENHSKTKRRATEDVQLAFYTALLQAPQSEDTGTDTGTNKVTTRSQIKSAFYLGLDAGGKTTTQGQVDAYSLPDPQLAAAELLSGIASDLDRIAQGAIMPALGEGKICTYCSVRGLCQRDYWK